MTPETADPLRVHDLEDRLGVSGSTVRTWLSFYEDAAGRDLPRGDRNAYLVPPDVAAAIEAAHRRADRSEASRREALEAVLAQREAERGDDASAATTASDSTDESVGREGPPAPAPVSEPAAESMPAPVPRSARPADDRRTSSTIFAFILGVLVGAALTGLGFLQGR